MTIFAEIKLLNGNTKGIFFICFFRLSSFFTRNPLLKILGIPIRGLYVVIVRWILGIDIIDSTTIGRGFSVFHGQGIVISADTIIGHRVIIRQNTTIGSKVFGGKGPVIEDEVDIGANSVIIGDIKIGRGAIIAAGSVVVKDVAAYTVVAGNPAKFLRYRE